MDKALYYLVNPEGDVTNEDFSKILSLLGELKGIGVNVPTEEINTAYVFYEFESMAAFRPKLKLIDQDTEFKWLDKKLPSKRIELETELTDVGSAYMLMDVAEKLGLRVFFTNISCYLPLGIDFHDCVTITTKEHKEAEKIMLGYNLKPLFMLEKTLIYFAVSETDGSVHIVNSNLLSYLMLVQNTNTKSSEFSYKVADNVEDFVRKSDADLIPTSFYKYYKKSLKIIDYSGFNFENPDRKVFVKPLIYRHDSSKIDFFKIAWDDSMLMYMDKIRPGENLDKTILRILREELKIAQDYVGAAVSPNIEFDLDKNNELTPRLIVRIYIKDVHLTPEQLEKKDRTWISFDQIKDAAGK